MNKATMDDRTGLYLKKKEQSQCRDKLQQAREHLRLLGAELNARHFDEEL